MELYIIRHGETDWNKQKLLQGQSDIPLNEYGRELARITAQAVGDIHFDTVYASPLVRALETAQILTERTDIITDRRLMEISFGVGEGVESSQLGSAFLDFFFAPERYIPPQGGETYGQLCKRAQDFVSEKLLPLRGEEKTILIVAHGAMNKAIMAVLKNTPVKDFWTGEFQKNCCVNHYHFTQEEMQIVYEAKIFYTEKQERI